MADFAGELRQKSNTASKLSSVLLLLLGGNFLIALLDYIDRTNKQNK